MAKLTITSTAQIVDNDDTLGVTLNNSYTTTGSWIGQRVNVPTGSWTLLSTGSLHDVRTVFFSNNDFTSSVFVAINNTGSGYDVYWPQDTGNRNFNGPANIYVQASGSNPIVSFSYRIISNF